MRVVRNANRKTDYCCRTKPRSKRSCSEIVIIEQKEGSAEEGNGQGQKGEQAVAHQEMHEQGGRTNDRSDPTKLCLCAALNMVNRSATADQDRFKMVNRSATADQDPT